jgi:hypothetical protein
MRDTSLFITLAVAISVPIVAGISLITIVIVAVRVAAIIAAGRIAFAFTTITVAFIAIAVVTIIFAFVFLVAFLSLIIIGTAVSRLGDFGMFAFPGRIEDAVVRLVGILPASLLVDFGYCNMLTFTTWVEDTVVGFICVFCPIVRSLCDFGVLTFATWIENAVIRFISVFGGFRMLSSAS